MDVLTRMFLCGRPNCSPGIAELFVMTSIARMVRTTDQPTMPVINALGRTFKQNSFSVVADFNSHIKAIYYLHTSWQPYAMVRSTNILVPISDTTNVNSGWIKTIFIMVPKWQILDAVKPWHDLVMPYKRNMTQYLFHVRRVVHCNNLPGYLCEWLAMSRHVVLVMGGGGVRSVQPK